MSRAVDMTGRRVGRLTVLERVGSDKWKRARWRCLCQCGNMTIALSAHLRSGHTKSCGCFRKETASRSLIEGGNRFSGKDANYYLTVGNIACIVLSGSKYGVGGIALIDSSDIERVQDYRWHARSARSNSFYASCTNANGRQVQLSRVLMSDELVGQEHLQVDHINGDTLDNRRDNLRLCTNQQNNCNKGPCRNNTSGYKGVSWFKSRGKYRARIHVHAIEKHLGCFDTPEEAALAYNEAAIKHFGEFAYLNEVVNS